MSRSTKLWAALGGLTVTTMIAIAWTLLPIAETNGARASSGQDDRVQVDSGSDTDSTTLEGAPDPGAANMDEDRWTAGGGSFVLRRSAGPLDFEVIAAGVDPAGWELDLVEGPGIVIDGLIADGPAHQAGLDRGDILLAVDDQTVDDPVELAEIIAERAPGDEVELRFRHGDAEQVVTARLAERDGSAWLGLPIWNPVRSFFHPAPSSATLQGGSEARVVEVRSGSAAQSAGIQAGDRIVGLDGETLEEGDDLAEAIASRSPGSRLRVTVERMIEGRDEPETVELEATLDAHPEDSSLGFLGVELAITRRIEIIHGQPSSQGR